MKITGSNVRRTAVRKPQRQVRPRFTATGPLSKVQKRAVYALLREGLSNAEIAALLHVSGPQVGACAAHRTMGHVD